MLWAYGQRSVRQNPQDVFSLSFILAGMCTGAWGYSFPGVGFCICLRNALWSSYQFLQLLKVPQNNSTITVYQMFFPILCHLQTC